MRILLVAMGGAIDTVAAVMPFAELPTECSQALHMLYTISQSRKKKRDELDHFSFGKHAATTITKSAMSSLIATVQAAQGKNFDRIVVTVPSMLAESMAYSVSRYIPRVDCPVVTTGAELPDPKDFAVNAMNNLFMAAFEHAYAMPDFYSVTEDRLAPVMPRRSIYRSHKWPRSNGCAWMPSRMLLQRNTATFGPEN